MKQALTDDPKEAERQKIPILFVAICLSIALIAAFILFFLPAFVPDDDQEARNSLSSSAPLPD